MLIKSKEMKKSQVFQQYKINAKIYLETISKSKNLHKLFSCLIGTCIFLTPDWLYVLLYVQYVLFLLK